MRRWRDVRMTVSQVPLRARPFVCRKLSPAPARLRFLALGGLHFDKMIINRFVLVHPSSRIVVMRRSNTRSYNSLLC